jgi:hypothetical protein
MRDAKRLQILKFITQTLEAEGVDFSIDPHCLTLSQAQELTEWADSVRYKGSSSSSMGQGRLFFMHLKRSKALMGE